MSLNFTLVEGLSPARGIATEKAFGDALAEALGYTPKPRQVRVNGQELIVNDLNQVTSATVPPQATVQIVTEEIAEKGAGGAGL